MTPGFGGEERQDALTRELISWELYQVQVDKYGSVARFRGLSWVRYDRRRV
jgi:hypothetical protein